jgi:hypothetical protein
MMKERKVPVSPYHPCADVDDDAEPVQGPLHKRGRAKRWEKKT